MEHFRFLDGSVDRGLSLPGSYDPALVALSQFGDTLFEFMFHRLVLREPTILTGPSRTRNPKNAPKSIQHTFPASESP